MHEFKDMLHIVRESAWARVSIDQLPGEAERLHNALRDPEIASAFKNGFMQMVEVLYPFLRPLTGSSIMVLDSFHTDFLPLASVLQDLTALFKGEDTTLFACSVRAAFALTRIQHGVGRYTLSDGLAAQLLETDIHGLRCADLQAPYKSTYWSLPPTPVGILDQGERLRGFLLHEDENRKWIVVGELTNATISRTTYLSGGFDLSQPSAAIEDAWYVPHSNESAELHNSMLRFIVNALLYATWPDAEVDHVFMNPHARKLWEKIQNTPKCKRRERLQTLLDGMDTTKTHLLGRNVICVSRQKAMERDHAAGRNTGARLMAYQKVPGHWKHQPYGPHSSLRKRIWIQPYVRGPEDGVMSMPIHKLVGAAG